MLLEPSFGLWIYNKGEPFSLDVAGDTYTNTIEIKGYWMLKGVGRDTYVNSFDASMIYVFDNNYKGWVADPVLIPRGNGIWVK